MNTAVGAYKSTVENLAQQFVGRNGAEFDDLVQEGLINVWQSLMRKVTPSADIIEDRMKNYVRWLGRRLPTPYEALLPLDDYRVGGELRPSPVDAFIAAQDE